jgi:hypothetical protein
MCRNIKPLFNFDPPASNAEIHEASLQFVRKISGMRTPAQGNAAAFDSAVDEIGASIKRMLDALQTNAPAKDRAIEAARARARSAKRFARRQQVD